MCVTNGGTTAAAPPARLTAPESPRPARGDSPRWRGTVGEERGEGGSKDLGEALDSLADALPMGEDTPPIRLVPVVKVTAPARSGELCASDSSNVVCNAC